MGFEKWRDPDNVKTVISALAALTAVASAVAAGTSAYVARATLKATENNSVAQSVAVRNIASYLQRQALASLANKQRGSNQREYDAILGQMNQIRYDLMDQRMIEPMLNIKILGLRARAYEGGEKTVNVDQTITGLKDNLSRLDRIIRETGNVYFGDRCIAFVGDSRPTDDASCKDLRLQ